MTILGGRRLRADDGRMRRGELAEVGGCCCWGEEEEEEETMGRKKG